MASPAYDKFMAFADSLRLDAKTTEKLKAEGKALHTDAVTEEVVQNQLRVLLIRKDALVAVGASTADLAHIDSMAEILVELRDSRSVATPDDFIDAATEWKTRLNG